MLKVRYESKDQIPEGMADHYAEDENGGFVLQAEGLKTQGDVDKVQEALNKERRTRREAEKQYKELSESLPEDFSMDEWNRLKDNDGGNVDEKLREQRERIQSQAEKEKSSLKEQLDAKKNTIHQMVAREGLRNAMADNNIAEPYQGAVEAMLLPHVSVEGDGDDIAAVLNDKPLEQAVAEFAKSDQGQYFVAARQNSGSGATNSGGMPGKNFADMSLDERGQLYQQDPEQYRQLREQARQQQV